MTTFVCYATAASLTGSAFGSSHPGFFILPHAAAGPLRATTDSADNSPDEAPPPEGPRLPLEGPLLPPWSWQAALHPVLQLGSGVAAGIKSWVGRWYVKVLLWLAGALLGLHVLLNLALVPLLNHHVVPRVTQQAAQVLQREVREGGGGAAGRCNASWCVGRGVTVGSSGTFVGPLLGLCCPWLVFCRMWSNSDALLAELMWTQNSPS